MPSIREISEACGASKPTVTRRLHELGLWDAHVNKAGAQYVVDDYAASAVAASFSSQSADEGGQDARTAHPAPSPVVASLERYISSLEAQLDAKDGQISALIEQNARLSERLDALSDRAAALSEQVARASAIAERPRGIWSRLLGGGEG